MTPDDDDDDDDGDDDDDDDDETNIKTAKWALSGAMACVSTGHSKWSIKTTQCR